MGREEEVTQKKSKWPERENRKETESKGRGRVVVVERSGGARVLGKEGSRQDTFLAA